MTVVRNRAGFHSSHIALLASSIHLGIAVQDLLPETATWNPNPIVMADDRSEVADDQDDVLRRASSANKAQNTMLCVVAIDPLETSRVAVPFVESRFAAVESIEILYPPLQAGVWSML